MIAVWVQKTALSAAGCTQTAIMGGRVRSVPRTRWASRRASRILDTAPPRSWNLANLDYKKRSWTEGCTWGSQLPIYDTWGPQVPRIMLQSSETLTTFGDHGRTRRLGLRGDDQAMATPRHPLDVADGVDQHVVATRPPTVILFWPG